MEVSIRRSWSRRVKTGDQKLCLAWGIKIVISIDNFNSRTLLNWLQEFLPITLRPSATFYYPWSFIGGAEELREIPKDIRSCQVPFPSCNGEADIRYQEVVAQNSWYGWAAASVSRFTLCIEWLDAWFRSNQDSPYMHTHAHAHTRIHTHEVSGSVCLVQHG